MKSPIINSTALVSLALSALTGCGGIIEGSSVDPVVSPNVGVIKLNISLSTYDEIRGISYEVSCDDGFTSSGTWEVANSHLISGVLGGMRSGANCAVSVHGYWSTMSTGPNTYCTAPVSNVVASADPAQPAATNISLTCVTTEYGNRPPPCSTCGTGWVTVSGFTHYCGCIDAYTASFTKVVVGQSIALQANPCPGTTSDGSAPSNSFIYVWTAQDGPAFSSNDQSATYTCTEVGTFTLRISITDDYANPDGTERCGTHSDTFQIVCAPPAN